jgi:hypothetical protein
MAMKDRFKEVMFRTKVFLWYIVTEPFRQLYEFLYYLGEMLNRTISWVYVFLVISIIALILGKRPVAGFFMIILLVTILLWEWNSGFFMNRYREREKKRIEKILRKEEEKK